MNYFSMFRQFFAVIIISGLPATGVWSQPPEQLEQHILQQLGDGNDVESLLIEWHSQHRPDRHGKRSFQSLPQHSAGQLPQTLTELRKALERVLAKSAGTRLPAELQTPYDAFRAADALIKAQFETVTARLTEINADSVIRQRLQKAHSAYTATSDQLLQTIDAGFHSASAAQTEDLQRVIELLTRLPTATTSLLRTELPFRRFNPASRSPAVLPAIQPVYHSDESPVAGDLGPGPLTPLSEPVLSQAAALDYDPVRIFEFVRNRIDSEWYTGAKYGAETTLALLRGNDVDQASLLIALLRASQIPARYVHGVIELPLAALADDLELTDDSLVSAALTRAGVAFTPVIRGGRIAAVQIEYTWVAARVPYSNYRGAVVDFSGPVWLPLAPAFKHYQITPAHAVLSQMAFDPRTLLDDYLSTVQTVEPLKRIREEVEAFLAGNSDYAAQLGNRTLQPEQLQLLPNSLPFEVVAVSAEYQQLPPALQQQVRLSIQAETSAQSLLDVTLPLAKLNQRRVTLSYIPATVADHDTVNAFGGLSNTPAYLIELRPQLKIDGHPEAVAEHALAMGANHRLMVELIAPAGSTATTQTLIAGSYYALAIGEGSDTPSAEPDPDAETAPGDSEYLAARLLSHIAHYYNHRWRLAEQELAGLHRLSLLRPLPAVVIAGNAVELQYALDQPYALNWQGVNLDAALRLVEPVSADNDSRAERDWFRLSALQGSFLEQQVFRERFQVEAISADKGLALARQQGIEVIELNAGNAAAVLPTLDLTDNVRQAIADAVQTGYQVSVPRIPVTLNAWQGSVWRIEDPVSGGAGYFISGGLAGGASAEAPANWVLDFLAEALAFPYSAEPNNDPGAVSSLEKLSGSGQTTSVGDWLAEPLAVRALDPDGRPVAGVIIQFRVTGGGGGLGSEEDGQFTAQTDASGIARISFRSGEVTALNPIYVKRTDQDNYATQALINEIDVHIENTAIRIRTPFTVIAYPSAPAQLQRSDSIEFEGSAGTWSETVQSIVYDAFGNPVANVPVTFRAKAYKNLCQTPPPVSPQNSVFFISSECPFENPILGQCGQPSLTRQTSTFGSVSANLILGNIAKAEYTYEISSSGLDPQTFEIISDDNCSTGQLKAHTWFPVNEWGDNINAARVGEPSAVPVPLMLLYSQVKDGLVSWQPTHGNVGFSVDNGATAGNTVSGGGGVYQTTIVTGANPGFNTVSFGATNLDVPTGIPDNLSAPFSFVTGLDPQITTIAPARINLDPFGFSQTPLELTYQIQPSTYRARSVEVVISENGQPKWTRPGNYRDGAGGARFSRGLEFNIAAEYTAQLIINRGSELEVRSDALAIPLGQGIFRAWSRSLSLVQDIDLVNRRYCNNSATFSFSLAQRARVSLKFIRIESRGGLLSQGSQTVLLDDELYDEGEHALPIAADTLIPGTYRFELRGVATANNREETVGGGAVVRITRRDHLPVGHTLVKGVNLWNGTMSLGREDITLPGRGPDLRFQRTYSSASKAEGVLGFGWSHNYDSHLLITSCGEVILVGGEGGGMRFVDDGQGGLRALAGFHGSLIANAEDASFDFYAKDGTRYHYATPRENRWRLAFIEDSNGHRSTLNYDSGTRQHLVSVVDSAGRSLQFFYQNLNLVVDDANATPLWSGEVIERIQGPDDLAIAFGYDALGRLVSATRRRAGEDYWRETYDYADYRDTASGYGWDDRYLLIAATDTIRDATTRYGYLNTELDAGFAEDASYPNSFTREVIMPEGGRTTFQYTPLSTNAASLQREVTDSRDATTTYTLNTYGSATEIRDALGNITQMSWADNDVVMTQRIDANGVVTDYSYDEFGNVASEIMRDIADFEGVQRDYVTLYNYWPPHGFDPPFIKNRLRSLTTPNSAVSEYRYDSHGNLLEESVAGTDYQILHTYYANGDRKTSSDANGNLTQFSYDDYGFPDRVTDAQGHVSDTDYDSRGRLLQHSDAAGRITRYAYDSRDRQVRIEYPSVDSESAVEIIDYDDAAGTKTHTDAAGRSTITESDREDRVVHIRTALTEKTFAYDAEGNKTRESFWFDDVTAQRDILFSYDAAGRLQQKTEPQGRVTSYEYDSAANLIGETLQDSSNGSFIPRISHYSYDGLNRRISEAHRLIDEAGEQWVTTANRYDGAGNVILMQDALGRHTQQEFDALNRLTKVIDALGNIVEYGYDANGNKTRETRYNSPQNQVRQWQYDTLNRLKKTTDAEGNTTEYFYDVVGNIVKIVDPRLNVTEHAYDVRNRKIETRLRLDRISGLGSALTTFEYDRVGNLLAEYWPNGNSVRHQYDALNRKIHSSDNLGELQTFAYDAEGNVVRSIDANGNTTIRIYDDLFRLIEEQLPEERTQRYRYDAAGNRLSHTNGRGHTTTLAYDSLNRLIKTIDPAPFDNEECYHYDLAGNRIAVTDRRGFITTFEYDALNRQIALTTPEPFAFSETYSYDAVGNRIRHSDRRGIVTETRYDRENRVIEVRRDGLTTEQRGYDAAGNTRFLTDANGHTTSFEYDERQQTIAENRPLAAVTRYQRDLIGDLISERDPEGRLIRYDYDLRRRQTSQTRERSDGADETMLFEYDGNGNRTAVQHPEGNRTTFAYDGADRLTSVSIATDILNLTTAYRYDSTDNRISQTDPNGHTTSFEYDERNRLTRKFYPQQASGQSEQEDYVYDAGGNLIERTDAKAQLVTFNYDELNRLIRTDYPLAVPAIPGDDPLLSIERSYDASNNLLTVSEHYAGSSERSTHHSYDAFDRLESVTDADGKTLQYAYDANGNRERLIDPDGRVSRYEYDELNRVSAVVIAGTGITEYDYHRDSRLKRIRYPNGSEAEYDYDDAGRLHNIDNSAAGASVSGFAYVYDGNGNRIEQLEIQGGISELTTYRYDPADRLESVVYPDSRVEYSYDNAGNRFSEQVWDSNEVRTADKRYRYDARDRLESISDSEDPTQDADYQFDANGNLTERISNGQTTAFHYNSRNQLTLVSAAGQNDSRYRYDHQGLRTQKQTDSGVVNYIYDDQSVLLQTDADHQTVAKYDYGPDRLLSLGHRSEPRQFYLFDALGSVVNLVNNAGSVQARYQYDAWGNPRSTIGESANPFGFTGHERDEETGLYYAKARFYDPVIGRFLNEDPYQGDIQTPPSLHRYLYAYQNPTVFVDPDGRVGFLSDLQNLFDNHIVPTWQERFDSLDENAGLGETLITGALYGFANATSSVATGLNTASNVVASSLPEDLIGGVKQDAQAELDRTVQATSEAIEAVHQTTQTIIEDPSGTVEKVHAAAVEYTTALIEGDRQALATIPKVVAEGIALPPIARGAHLAGQASAKVAKELAEQIADDMVSVPSGRLKAQRGVVSLNGLPELKLPNSPEIQEYKSSARRAYLNKKFARTGDLHKDISVRGYWELANKLSVATERNKAVFWSGFKPNFSRAIKYAKQWGKKTIESTEAGNYFRYEALLARLGAEETSLIWNHLSRRYAQAASGEVTAFTFGGHPTSRGVFWKIELPTLINNKNVTSVSLR